MEKEVSNVIELGVTLVAVAALISIVWFTVYLGNSISGDAGESADKLLNVMQVGALDELSEGENLMTTASVYSVLRTNSAYIPEYTCYLHNVRVPVVEDLTENAAPCVLQHMTGKVKMLVERTSSGWYRVAIHDVTCPNSNFSGECSYCYNKYK